MIGRWFKSDWTATDRVQQSPIYDSKRVLGHAVHGLTGGIEAIRTRTLSRRCVLQLLTSVGLVGLARPSLSVAASINERLGGNIAPVHDPCIIKAGDTYHLFATGQQATGLLPWRVSRDLVHWELRGHVFEAIPQWALAEIPGTRGLWAPDIAHFNGRYHLYYSVSTFGSNRSAIGLVTNATLDADAAEFEWRDEGLVIESHREDDFNAIDPNHFIDRDGKHWLTLGSFWGGIQLFALDPATGKPPAHDRSRRVLASRPVPPTAPSAIEAPFLIERGGYYYLFVSFDYCCRGEHSSYYLVVGRSRNVTGPYVGRDGRSMNEGYGTLLVRGNRRFRAVGHNAVLRDEDEDYLVYHAYDGEHEGRPTLRISPIEWADGWPSVTL